MNEAPPILEYRSVRVDRPPRNWRALWAAAEGLIMLLLGSAFILLGCTYVVAAIVRYANSAEPFEPLAAVVALALLVTAVAFGLSLRTTR